MASSETEIANQAISHLAISKEISALSTDKTIEALTIKRYYADSRDETLRDFPWPFATRIATLALVASDPNNEWAFSYRLPTGCLMFRKIQSGRRSDVPETRVPYRIASDNSGGLIFTDQADAIAEYTTRISDVSQFPADFVSALSFLLAFKAAPRITAGDPFKLGERAANSYVMMLTKAQKNALNEEQPDRVPESEFIRVRSGVSSDGKTFLTESITDFPAQD